MGKRTRPPKKEKKKKKKKTNFLIARPGGGTGTWEKYYTGTPLKKHVGGIKNSCTKD